LPARAEDDPENGTADEWAKLLALAGRQVSQIVQAYL
jgi:hypothetical protein